MYGMSDEVLEMISKSCYNCGKVKQCKMVLSCCTREHPKNDCKDRLIEYLCNTCAKELGHD